MCVCYYVRKMSIMMYTNFSTNLWWQLALCSLGCCDNLIRAHMVITPLLKMDQKMVKANLKKLPYFYNFLSLCFYSK